MVVQVGDKVLVYGAGTPWAFAKKIDPVEVGDKVDVVTLSDGTKLAMPKIELDLSEYVWVVPEFDTPFNIGDVPFQWGMMPLGAAVFTVTGTDINLVIDENREWEPGELSGCYIFFLSGKLRGGALYIVSNSETTYTVCPLESKPVYWELIYSKYGDGKGTHGGRSVYVGPGAGNLIFEAVDPVPLVGKYAEFAYRGYGSYAYGGTAFLSCGVGTEYGDAVLMPFLYGTPDFPNVTAVSAETTVVNNSYLPRLQVMYTGSTGWFELLYLLYRDELDCADDVAIGDKYMIYNPTTKRLMFNDATKTVLSAASWRAINYPGEVVTVSPVEYVWDGAGTVYLTQSKTTLSTIFYDNELRVEAFGDTGDVRAIDYHTNDEYTYSGETVSRELVNITSILRAGKNYVQLKARDTGGTKVGFPTPIYIKRDMS